MRYAGEAVGRRRPTGTAAAALLWLLAAAAPAAAQTGGEAARLRGGDAWRTDFARAAVPLSEIVSGGPPKDGIPGIDRPRFESAEAADGWLGERSPVVVLEHGGVVKAYPLGILIWHEIVNDEIGGLPASVTFCPLCNTALAFDRRVGSRTLDFGTTGRLRHSDLVMYDRQTETWWQQATGEAIVGELTGEKLRLLPANTLAWGFVKRSHPDVRVLSRHTGFPEYEAAGRYGRNPYVGYDRRRRPFERFFRARDDDRLPAMERVVAIDAGRGWAAPFSALAREGVANVTVEGRPIVVLWAAGAASALDADRIDTGRDVGQAAVFDRRVEGRTLSFRRRGDGYRDAETGSSWDLSGRAVAGPLAGKRLEAVPHGNHFWFAWGVFRPETEVWKP